MAASVHTLSADGIARMETAGMLGGNTGIPVDRLREVRASFIDFNGHTQQGALVVMDAAAPDIAALCDAFYDIGFPIHSMRPICAFNGSDDASMAANNSSAFNGRKIAQTNMLSIHAYGLAVDINPAQNPYILPSEDTAGIVELYPPQAMEYINRMHARPGMVEPIVPLCRKHGLTLWGGGWHGTPDWHHFQTPRIIAQLCAALAPDEARALYILNKRFPERFLCVTEDEAIALRRIITHQSGSACIDVCTRVVTSGAPWAGGRHITAT